MHACETPQRKVYNYFLGAPYYAPYVKDNGISNRMYTKKLETRGTCGGIASATQQVTQEEFISGILRCKGQARAIEQVAMHSETPLQLCPPRLGRLEWIQERGVCLQLLKQLFKQASNHQTN